MKLVTGAFLRPDGTVAAGATVKFLLSQNAAVSVGLLVHEQVQVVLDANGSLGAGVDLWCNDEMETLGTNYLVTLTDPVYGQVLYERVVIAGASPINLPALTPIFTK